MRQRFGIVLCLLCFQAPAGAQEPPPDQSRVVTTAPRCTLSGHIDLHYLYRDGALDEARGAINSSAAGPVDSGAAISGPVSLRLDCELDAHLRAALELERLPYDAGTNLGFGDDAISPVIDQAYVEIDDFLVDRLKLRLGQFDFSYRLRPQGEPFFFDSRGESFWSGATAAFVRTTADRDLAASAGLRLQYDIGAIALAEWALVVRDKTGASHPSDDELMSILYLNAITGEHTALFVIAALAAGPDHDREVWTIGAGADQYFGAGRAIELFAEAYTQFGRIGPGVAKRAWALQAGARGVLPSGLWAEAAFVYRSGDRRPTDSRDETFQSAERVDRFMIVESAEFGLDWDTNIRAFELGAGSAVSSRVTVRADAGWFAFNEDLVTAAGAPLLGTSRSRIGIELDGTIAYSLNAQARLSLRGGLLVRSEVLEALTTDGSSTAWVIAGGVEAGY